MKVILMWSSSGKMTVLGLLVHNLGTENRSGEILEEIVLREANDEQLQSLINYSK